MKERSMTYAAAAKAVRSARTIIITSHLNPDGDGLGSGLALLFALERLGKRVAFACPSEPHRTWGFLPGAKRIVPVEDAEAVARFLRTKAGREADLVISCDAGDLRRLGAVADIAGAVRARGGRLLNLDHHVTNDRFGDINLVDVAGESSGVVVERLLRLLKCPVDKRIAELLYVTIVYDTGRFMHSNTTAHTFAWTAKLLEHGIDAAAINRRLSYTKSLQELQVQAMALERLRVDAEEAKLAGIAISAKDTAELVQRLGKIEDWGDLVELPRSLQGNEVAYLVRERDDGKGPGPGPYCKLSLRSNPPFAIGAVAQHFGGGGHAQAAGATVEGTLEQVLAELLPRLRAAARTKAGKPAKRANG